jgi:cation diffusion facilitator CzcD-associated flavoprotein CzcO
LHPYHIVLAIGTVGKPRIPRLPGRLEFKGEAYHATTFKGALPYAGKKTIVVGACQSAADICQDLVARGAASVTMVQRSSTIVIASEYIDEQLDQFWPVHGDVSVGDFRYVAMPLGLLKKLQIAEKDRRVEAQKVMLEGLLKAGLNVNEGPEGAGQLFIHYEKFGGTCRSMSLNLS